MSIKRKLTWMTMGISSAAVVMTVMSITSYLIYDMHRNKTESLALTAAIAGDRNRAALMFQYKEQAQSNLEIYRMSPSIQQACLYTAAGDLFSGYQSSDSAQSCPPHFSATSKHLPGLLAVTTPIRKDADLFGYVYLVSDMRELYTYIEKIAQISIAVISIVLAAALFLTLYFRRMITEPLLELASTAQSIIASGNYNLQARDHYPDETGLLAKTFNAMLQEVRKRDAELVLSNEGLEEKIATRTHELEDAKRKAEQASETKSEFLRNMSHEFRTPLHAILSFSVYGVKEHATAARTELLKYFDQIKKSSERLGKLVNEVLDLARLEHGYVTLATRYADLRDIAGIAVEGMRPLMENKHITLKVDHAEEAVGVMCDQDKIVQVMTNLLSNAVKFTPEGKSITLVTRLRETPNGEDAVVSLLDEGIGIPEDEKETIFESFRQSTRTNTGAGGTGLGLAICKNIVTAHHGRIWAANNPASGACFTFCLPSSHAPLHPTMHPLTEMPHEAFTQN